MELKCKRCEKEWNYNGKSEFWATCPNCLTKVKVVKNEEIEETKEE